MSDFLAALPQMLVSGLAIGSLYALVAQGFYITYAGTKTFNFAQGDLVMVGVIIAAALVGGLPIRFTGLMDSPIPAPVVPFLVAAVLAILGAIALGLLTERLAIAPLKSFGQHSWFVSTAAISFIVINLTELIFGREFQPFRSPFGSSVIRVGSTGIFPQEIFVFIASLAAMAILWMFLERSQLGRALRAVAFNREAAELMGIDARKMAIFSYGLSAGVAGLAGVLVGPIMGASVYIGLALLVKAFIAAIIGGMDKPQGILVGGLILGVGEKILSYTVASWAEAAMLFLVIAFLGLRPFGLLGQRPVEKV